MLHAALTLRIADAICPRCGEPGAHNDEDCLAALHEAIAALPARRRLVVPPIVVRTVTLEDEWIVARPDGHPRIAVSLADAAALAGMNPQTIGRWIREQKVDWTGGRGHRRVYLDSLFREVKRNVQR